MRVIQAKVRCVDGVLDTGWFVPGRETTVIFGPPGSGKAKLFQALQALNPLYEITHEKPFAGHPDTWHQGAYTRRVIPEKKTAVVMVFSAEPEHVLELERIDPVLIETDRIEVGRRLDYSRWTTFVEISASTRWSDISEQMHRLRMRLAGRTNLPEAALQDAFFTQLNGSDRLKGETADACRHWLEAVAPLLPTSDGETFRECLSGVGRAERFTLARKKVAEWLPLTISLQPGYRLESAYTFAEISGERQVYHPLESLLGTLCRKFQLHGAEDERPQDVAEAIERAAPSMRVFQELGLVLPSFRTDRDRLFLERVVPRNRVKERLYRIAVICLLLELCHGHRPLLLLDRFDRDLSSAETLELVESLQRLGNYCQLIMATENETVRRANGWQAVKLIGPGGLAATKLVSG